MSQYGNNKYRLLKSWCLQYLGGKKCNTCSIDYLPQACYDFHHKNGDKNDNISSMIQKNSNKSELKKELDKTIILCKNCHSIKHHDSD